MVGIYKIENLVNNHIYVGCASNLAVRKNGHFSSLRNGKHRNQYLQRAFNKYGESSFKFSVLELCDKPFLVKREQYWIDLAQTEESHLYNLELVATRTELIKPRKYWLGKTRSEEDKKKFRESHIGKCGVLRKTNKTGYAGVAFNSTNKNYRARITINGICHELGSFMTLESAIEARKIAEKTLPGVKTW